MKKEQIISSYYIEHLKVKDISKNFNVSSAYVTKVIKQDDRYMEEKEYRKNSAKLKRKNAQNKFMKDKRAKKQFDNSINSLILKRMHDQASAELSQAKHLSNESFRKWNYSAYTYNPSKHRYEFDERLGRASDVPKYINERY